MLARRLLTVGAGASLEFPAPDPPPADPITVTFAWVGGVTDGSAVVKARSADAVTMSLRYALNEAMTSVPITVDGTEGNDEVWTFDLSGLDPDTLYYFMFPGSDLAGSFRTFPEEGSEASFLVAAASCAGQASQAQYVTGPSRTSDSPAFERIQDRAPAVFIHMGDLHYKDIGTNSVASFRSAYRDVMANERQHNLYRHVPLSYVWDDHDYGQNDANGSSASRAAAQAAYRDYVPHYTLPDSEAVYHQFVIGRVRFIRLDTRSYRSPNGTTDGPSKTMLGTSQKSWLMSALLAATEPCIVLVCQDPWNGSGSDNWGSFATERQELAEFFEDEGLTSRLILLAGDMHRVAIDDGTNSQYDPDAVTDGPPILQFAPLDGGSTTLQGTYSEGSFHARKQQYGTIEFDDQGSQIVVTAKGWSVNNAIETELVSFEMTFSA